MFVKPVTVTLKAMIIIIIDEPANVSIDAPKEIKKTVGDLASISCSARGRPLPSLLWYRNGTRLSTNTSKHLNITHNVLNSHRIKSNLAVGPVTLDDEAVYTCTASNTLPNGTFALSASVKLDIIGKQHFESSHTQSTCMHSF